MEWVGHEIARGEGEVEEEVEEKSSRDYGRKAEMG